MPFGVEVSIFSGSNLDKKESPSRVQIVCGDSHAETAGLKINGDSLEWNETFYLADCPDSEPILYFNLKGKGNDPVAIGELAVSYIKQMQDWRGDIPGPAGSLQVRCVLDSTGRPHGHGGPPPPPGGSPGKPGRGGFGHRM